MYAAVARSEGLSVTDEEMRGLMREAHARLPRELGGAWRYELAWCSSVIEEVFLNALGLDRIRLRAVQGALFAEF